MSINSLYSHVETLSHQLIPHSLFAIDEELKSDLKRSFINKINRLNCDVTIEKIQMIARTSFGFENNDVFNDKAITDTMNKIVYLWNQPRKILESLEYVTIRQASLSHPLSSPSQTVIGAGAFDKLISVAVSEHAEEIIISSPSKKRALESDVDHSFYDIGSGQCVNLQNTHTSHHVQSKPQQILSTPSQKQIFPWHYLYDLIVKDAHPMEFKVFLYRFKEMFRLELDFEQWLNQKDELGWSLLHYAVFYNQIIMVDYLVDYGANIHQITTRKETIIDLASRCYKGNRNILLIHLYALGAFPSSLELTDLDHPKILIGKILKGCLIDYSFNIPDAYLIQFLSPLSELSYFFGIGCSLNSHPMSKYKDICAGLITDKMSFDEVYQRLKSTKPQSVLSFLTDSFYQLAGALYLKSHLPSKPIIHELLDHILNLLSPLLAKNSLKSLSFIHAFRKQQQLNHPSIASFDAMENNWLNHHMTLNELLRWKNKLNPLY